MTNLQTIIKHNKLFYLSCLLLLGFGSFLLLQYTKPESFIALNETHTPGLDIFFTYYNYLGDGIFSIVLCVLLFFLKQKKLAIYLLVAYLSSGLISQVFKNLIYSPRPRIYFETHHIFFQLDRFATSGIGLNSFPSGHTTSAFAMATVLALFCSNKYWSLLFLAGAILAGYTRIYLAEHFPVDVLAGALIGIVFGTLTVMVLDRYTKKYSPLKTKIKKQGKI